MNLSDPRIQLELSLVHADAIGLKKAIGRCDPTWAFALHAFACMFAIESFGYLSQRGTVRVDFGEHAAAIKRARHGLKFLDDSKLAADGVLEVYSRVVQAHHRAFFDHHRGPLAPLKRFLQTDLGLFFHGGHLVGTTHLASAQLGWGDDRLSRLSAGKLDENPDETRQRSEFLGAYTTAVLEGLGVPPIPSGPRRAADPPRDVKADDFYRPLVATKSPRSMGMAMLVSAAVASSNVVLHVLPLLVDLAEPLEQLFITKWRLVVAAHVASSLLQLSAMSDSTTLLRPDVHRALVEVGARAGAIAKYRGLRNTFVHYAVRAGHGQTPPATLRQLVEMVAGVPFREAEQDVSDALQGVATRLSKLFPGFS